MRLTKAHIKNFRAISELEVPIDQHTVLIGANGVGKSCILKAVNKFFEKSASVTAEDFHEKNTADPIEIVLTFADLSPQECQAFEGRIFNGELSVARIFRFAVGARDNGKYFGLSLRNEEMQQIRLIDGALAKRAAFNALVGAEGFEGLQSATSAQQVQEHMDSWEAANHGRCNLLRDDGQFFGFTNVGRGSLSKYLSVVFVPAVRDAVADSVDSRGSVISQLIELIVKSVVQKRDDIVSWRAKASQEYQDLVRPENLGELHGLSSDLSETLGVFYSDSEVNLSWRAPEDLQINLPTAEVSLTEQGYAGPIEHKGHGLQRAFIFTLLQHLAKALSIQPNPPADEEIDAIIPDSVHVEISHSIIFIVEEPELYQHPIKQRHVANVLRRISGGMIEGVMTSTQVMLCSHSPCFVSSEHFNEIRLARREADLEGGSAQCIMRSVTYDDVNKSLDHAYQSPSGGHTDDSLMARLHTIDEAIAEGFFCNVAVLVEGVGDRAALLAVANARGVDLSSMGVAILPVGGKTKIDRPLAVFSLLKIPTYVVFDSDGNLPQDDRKALHNLAIQRLCGEASPIEIRDYVGDRFASFSNNLNINLKSELGDRYNDQVQLAAIKYGMPEKQVVKNPVSLSEVVSGCLANGGDCATLDAVVNRIAALAN